MVSLDLDHPDIEAFVNWKVTEEQKVASLVTGARINERGIHFATGKVHVRRPLFGAPTVTIDWSKPTLALDGSRSSGCTRESAAAHSSSVGFHAAALKAQRTRPDGFSSGSATATRRRDAASATARMSAALSCAEQGSRRLWRRSCGNRWRRISSCGCR